MSRSTRLDVWAVIRFEPESSEPQIIVTVKEILPTREEAEREVQRLQNLPDKPDGVSYFFQHTRYFPDGRFAHDTDRYST